MLSAVPYKAPGRLVLASSDLRRRNVQDFPLPDAGFLDLRNGAKNTFELRARLARISQLYGCI